MGKKRIFCPRCRTQHWWCRSETQAFNAGETVNIMCHRCGLQYVVWKKGNTMIIAEERRDD